MLIWNLDLPYVVVLSDEDNSPIELNQLTILYSVTSRHWFMSVDSSGPYLIQALTPSLFKLMAPAVEDGFSE